MRQSWDVILGNKHYNTVILREILYKQRYWRGVASCCVGVCEAEVVIRFGHGDPHITYLTQRTGVTNNSSQHKSAVVRNMRMKGKTERKKTENTELSLMFTNFDNQHFLQSNTWAMIRGRHDRTCSKGVFSLFSHQPPRGSLLLSRATSISIILCHFVAARKQ